MAKRAARKKAEPKKEAAPAETVGPAAGAVPAAGPARPSHRVRVRMYRQGLGDCFLLSFPREGNPHFHILIDCGVILGTPRAADLMKRVAADILEATKQAGGKSRVDVLVATHEHWDHLSGFQQARESFDALEVGQVWLAWTEDPGNDAANALRQARAQRLATLWMGFGAMRRALGADGDRSAEAILGAASQVLSFFGIDPEVESPRGEPGVSSAFAAAAKAVGSGTTAAVMEWLKAKTPAPKFWAPGTVIPLDAIGARAYVLGPPTDQTLLSRDMPTRSGRETYEAGPAAAERSFFGAVIAPDDREFRSESDKSQPFDMKYQVSEDKARAVEFYRDHYYGSACADGGGGDDWRRIDSAWASGAAEFALQLDSDTNNTSLALAFELSDGRVLLFPGDAQVGNWESWHADSEGKSRVFIIPAPASSPGGPSQVTAEQLLRRTVLYKVGHHGSHNATLREKGLEMMTDPDLTALVPVDVGIAHGKKHWNKMPFDPLMERLRRMTGRRLVIADEPSGALDFGPGLPDDSRTRRCSIRIVDATEGKTLALEGPGGTEVVRPLYVDYFLT